VAKLAPAYAPRRPTETVLYGIVRDNLESFLSWAAETYAKPLPRYVENELRAYLRCGDFSRGFLRCRCEDCGHDLLVAFSCKQRGACPSCAGRRMANTAAALVDRVIPDVPVRQYVLSLPFELRALAAFKPEVLRAIARLFAEAIFSVYRTRARRDGLTGGESGAVTFVQRFGYRHSYCTSCTFILRCRRSEPSGSERHRTRFALVPLLARRFSADSIAQ